MQFLILSLGFITGIVVCVYAAKPLNKTECVEWHNRYRKIHQAPDVKWSNTVAGHAQSWADDLANRDAFEHAKSRFGEGENMYKSGGDSDYSCRNAIKAFYNEEQYYDYDAAKYSSKAGHFTQVVWIKSTEIGVGKAMTGSGATILVFRYNPSGNYLGSFAENVKPPIGEAFVHRPSFMYSLGFSIISVFVAKQLF